MSNPDGQSEPSMEEILASIRRIISEDEKEQKGTAAPEGGETPGPGVSEAGVSEAGVSENVQTESEEEDVLDLTDKADKVEAPDPFEAQQETGFTEDVSETAATESQQQEDAYLGDIMQENPESHHVETSGPETSGPETSGMEEGLVSSATAAATVAVLSEASRDVRSQARAAEDLPIQSDKTLEGLVREAVKPLLREWLDQNLSPLVERVVREEVRRLVRRAEDD